jgi:hypothetical protein
MSPDGVAMVLGESLSARRASVLADGTVVRVQPDAVPEPVKPEPPAGRVLVLCVDCMPAKGSGTTYTFDDLVAPFARAVERTFTDQHGREAPLATGAYNLPPYSEGPRRVAALVARYLDGETAVLEEVGAVGALDVGGWILVNSAHPCASHALDVLTPHATLVVRGSR